MVAPRLLKMVGFIRFRWIPRFGLGRGDRTRACCFWTCAPGHLGVVTGFWWSIDKRRVCRLVAAKNRASNTGGEHV